MSVHAVKPIPYIHWGRVSERWRQARSAASAGPDDIQPAHQIEVTALHRLMTHADIPPLVLDVRHVDDRERSGVRIAQTEWRDSHQLAGWAGDLPKDRPVVVYCMYGFWVSQDTAAELREQGIDAVSLTGGIAAWRAMGYRSTSI